MNKTVLAIEDNKVNMLLVSRVVEAEGYDLLRAEDGPEALEVLKETSPDLILLDVNIPGINGLDLARKIKDDAKLSTVPVVATTANVLVGDKERCLEAGCDEYLPKPLDIRRLREVMHHYLDNNQP